MLEREVRMFWKRKVQQGVEELPGSQEIPDRVGRYLACDLRKDPEWVWKLRSVLRHNKRGKSIFDIRVFDEVQAVANKVTVENYVSLDEHPNLVLYQGWFDKGSLRMQIE
jgi:hypothetical protein